MNLEKINQISEKVAREGSIPAEGRYTAETANFFEVKLTKKGAKAISFGVMLKTDAKSGADVTGYSMQRFNLWNVSGVSSGTSKKGLAYSIDNEEALITTLARLGFSQDELVALVGAIESARPLQDDKVVLFGEGATAITTANGDILTFKGRTVNATIKHSVQTGGAYDGQVNVDLSISKAS